MNKHYNSKIIKNEINEYKKSYKDKSKIKNIFHLLVNHPNIVINKAIIYSKLYKYYKENSKGIINKIKMIYYARKNNLYANKYNIEIYGKFGTGLKIYHSNIIINNEAILGDSVKLHGNNCIGNNGKTDKCPIIGNNVDIGYGAVIIGDVKIADDVIIGANSVVTKSFLDKGCTIAGCPAKIIK